MNIHTGSSFDDFLAEEGILEEVSLGAQKRLLAIQAEEMIAEKQTTKLQSDYRQIDLQDSL